MLNKLRAHVELKDVALFFVVSAAMLCANNLWVGGQPFCVGLAFAMLYSGCGVLLCAMCAFASLAVGFTLGDLFCSVLAICVLCAIYGTLLKNKRKNAGAFIFLPASLVPYVITGEDALVRAVTVAMITVVSVCAIPSVEAIKQRLLRRAENFEKLSIGVLMTAVGIGLVKYVGLDAYKSITVLFALFFAAVSEGREACFVTTSLSLPAVINYKSPALILPYFLFGALLGLCGRGKVVSCLSLVAAEAFVGLLLGIYGEYGYASAIWFLAPVMIYLPVPRSVVKRLEEVLASGGERPLSRYEINRTRTVVAGRLYEISGTFKEISALFDTFDKTQNEFLHEDAIVDDVREICSACSFCAKCRMKGFPSAGEVKKLINVALARGRINAVDFPKSFSQKCAQTGKIAFTINKYVSAHGAEIDRQKVTADTRSLIAMQAEGVSFALKEMAKALSRTLDYRAVKERKLKGFLIKKGINVQEVMVFGEGEGCEIHLTVDSRMDAQRLIPAVNEFFKAKHSVAERFDVSSHTAVFILERACRFDCIFGVATAKKQGESACGDTHSLIRISHSKFMLALSDGMGSGEAAQTTSSASLSLIECFYRVGLPGQTALTLVNGLLSYAGEDNFTALDLAVIDLEGLTCDFIKLGAPYGFIISSGSVKLIEGSSLPMGILDTLRPSVCRENVQIGDVIIFVSDGVTDAFGSATDFAEYLTAIAVNNPQKLSDKILSEAFSQNGNVAKDDMTVVACKIFAA